MKSGPVFLWRGSVALLCEACQRLMIRWNIQTAARWRQAHWYVVIPNCGLSDADPQTFMHVHVLATQGHTVHAHIHSQSSHFAMVLIDDWNMASKGIHRKVIGRKKEWQRFREPAIWLLIPVMCRKLEKKIGCMQAIYPSPWWVDSKQLHTLYSGCMQWSMVFHCLSTLLKRHDRRTLTGPTYLHLLEHFKIQLQNWIWVILQCKKLRHEVTEVNKMHACQIESGPARDVLPHSPRMFIYFSISICSTSSIHCSSGNIFDLHSRNYSPERKISCLAPVEETWFAQSP